MSVTLSENHSNADNCVNGPGKYDVFDFSKMCKQVQEVYSYFVPR